MKMIVKKQELGLASVKIEGNHRNIKPFKQLFCCKVKMTMKSL